MKSPCFHRKNPQIGTSGTAVSAAVAASRNSWENPHGNVGISWEDPGKIVGKRGFHWDFWVPGVTSNMFF